MAWLLIWCIGGLVRLLASGALGWFGAVVWYLVGFACLGVGCRW